MPSVDFSQFPYYPSLLSGYGEHHGYRNLSSDDKDRLLPIFELSHRTNASNFAGVISDVRTSVADRVFLLDLNKTPAPPPYIPRDTDGQEERIARETQAQRSYNEHLTRLLDPEDGFAHWREQVAIFPGAVPVLQFSDPLSERLQILRQASLMSEVTDSMAIRISETTDAAIYEITAQIVSILRSPELLLIIFDCGQSRVYIPRRSQFAAGGIANVLRQLTPSSQSQLRAVCISNSFTNSDHDNLRDYENLDWRVWQSARTEFPFLFGDYGAMPRLRRTNTFVPPDWRASVVLPLDLSWLFYRHPDANDPRGWELGAQAVLAHDAAEPLPNVWGTSIIRRAAAGNIDDISSARFWHAAKVNIHLHRQVRYAPGALEGYEDLA